MPLEPSDILDRLRASGGHLAVAESLTGGLLVDAFVRVPGASDVLSGGVVAYANDAKTRLLGVPSETLRKHGAVSAETALAMAEGALKAFSTEYAVSTTGIAGPTGATKEKPVGLTYCAAVGPAGQAATRRVHAGDREAVRASALAQALETLASIVE